MSARATIREVSGELEGLMLKVALPFTGSVAAPPLTADDVLAFKLNLCAALLDRLNKRVALLSDAVAAHLKTGLEVFAYGVRSGGLRHDDPSVILRHAEASIAAAAAAKLVTDVKREVTELRKLRCISEAHAVTLRSAADTVAKPGGALRLLHGTRRLLATAARASEEFLEGAGGLAAELSKSKSWLARALAANYKARMEPLLRRSAGEVSDRLNPSHAGRGAERFREAARSILLTESR